MKAVVYTQYGPPEVLHLTDLPKPIPKDNEVLIKVYATTAHVGDTRMRSFSVPQEMWLFARLYLGVFKPRRKIQTQKKDTGNGVGWGGGSGWQGRDPLQTRRSSLCVNILGQFRRICRVQMYA